MSFEAALGIYAATFAIGVTSCLVPFISIEVFLVGLTLARGPADAIILIALAAVGQILGKLPVYYATRGLTSIEGRHRKWIDRLRAWVARTRCRPDLVLAASALLGVPPFAIASTAAGALEIKPVRFAWIIGVCRAARFAALIVITARVGR